jgi:hypothetical protein
MFQKNSKGHNLNEIVFFDETWNLSIKFDVVCCLLILTKILNFEKIPWGRSLFQNFFRKHQFTKYLADRHELVSIVN